MEMNKLLDTNIVLYFLAGKIDKLPVAENYYISINLKLPDAIIAATALFCDAEILSNDLQLRKINSLKCSNIAIK